MFSTTRKSEETLDIQTDLWHILDSHNSAQLNKYSTLHVEKISSKYKNFEHAN